MYICKYGTSQEYGSADFVSKTSCKCTYGVDAIVQGLCLLSILVDLEGQSNIKIITENCSVPIGLTVQRFKLMKTNFPLAFSLLL